MRAAAMSCAIVAAVLCVLAALWISQVVLERTDREALLGAFVMVCFAAPFAITTTVLSLRNRRKWPKFQLAASFGAFVLFALVGVWCVGFL
jgi:low temperature requirement protein LtrA